MSEQIESRQIEFGQIQSEQTKWFIIKQASEHCEIVDSATLETQNASSQEGDASIERWGPFDTKNQAIAKRVGLIRAGKCKPN